MVEEEKSSGSGVRDFLSALQSKGIEAAIFNSDGTMLSSKFNLSSELSETLSSMANLGAMMLERFGDKQKEFEFVASGNLVVLLPVKSYYLCGIMKDRQSKAVLREHAKNLDSILK